MHIGNEENKIPKFLLVTFCGISFHCFFFEACKCIHPYIFSKMRSYSTCGVIVCLFYLKYILELNSDMHQKIKSMDRDIW